MSWTSPKQLFATGLSLLLCRLLMAALPRLDPSMGVPASMTVVAELGLVLLLLVGFCMQMAGDERVVRAERERIAADLHDGLGFHLTTALALAADTRKADSDAWLAVDLAIVELHCVIHSMHSEKVPVVQAVGDLRYRLRNVVERQGLELVWEMRHDVPDDVLTGVAAYHFIKIVQEGLSNVLQHARATRLIVELRCPWPQRMLHLRIADNGRGISAERTETAGRGLAGMFRRARLLGGTLSIEPVPEGGTCLRLALPLPCRMVER